MRAAVCELFGASARWGCDTEHAVLLLWIACASTVAAVALAMYAPRHRVAAARVPTRPRSSPKAVLVGVEQAGKTNLFLRLAMHTAPHTATSQRVNTARVKRDGRLGDMELIDVPGHARLRTAVNDHLDDADALVFCIDASAASRGASTSATRHALDRTDLQTTLLDSVDFLHATLQTLAERRLSGKRAPPAVLLLFTRADKSPLFPERALLSDEKRRAQLLARCQRGVAAALTTRRASRGLDRRADAPGRVSVEAMTHVSDTRRSLLARAHTALAPALRAVPFLQWAAPPAEARTAPELHPTRLGHNVRGDAPDRAATAQPADYLAPGAHGTKDDLFLHLDPRIVEGGACAWGLASVDRDATWQPHTGEDHLGDLTAWLAHL